MDKNMSKCLHVSKKSIMYWVKEFHVKIIHVCVVGAGGNDYSYLVQCVSMN